MKRAGWVIVGRGKVDEAWHTFLDTASPTRGAAVRKWCPPEMTSVERWRHWRQLRKTGRAKLVRLYVKEDRT